MAKGNNSLTGKRSSSHTAKPYDANNSFVKKMATKVTDFIPQRSWITKWFNTSQGNEDETENSEETEPEEDVQQPPPSKRPRIRMDVTHPPGTFSIQPRVKTSIDKPDSSKEQYSIHDTMSEDFLEPASAGPSGLNHLISSTPAIQTDIRNIQSQRSDLNSLVAIPTNGATNGVDDNSESSESTSGCSSLIPQTNRQEVPSSGTYGSPFINRKRFIEDKLNFTNHLQSPRSLFLDNTTRDTLSSRRPSFNASVMSNPMDRTSTLSSPFYNGNITFGGANAAGLYKRNRTLFNNSNEFQLKVPRRTNIEVKPSDSVSVDSSGMSQTAKKILEALEHFSSPISDAKKIPIRSTSNTPSSLMYKKRSREEMDTSSVRVGLRHLTRELTVPTVPDILKLRRRQKLQDTTVAARKIVSARSELPPPQEYSLRSDGDDNAKYHGKVKTKSKMNIDDEDTIEKVNLPNIPLPISSLPTFNFAPAQYPNTTNKDVTSADNNFKFASPIKVMNTTNSLKSINNFTFSAPIDAEHKQDLDDLRQTPKSLIAGKAASSTNCTMSMPNFLWTNSSTAPRLKEKIVKTKDNVSEVSVAGELKSGSVMDVLCDKSKITNITFSQNTKENTSNEKVGENIFNVEQVRNDDNAFVQKAASTTWECSECFIKNNNVDAICIACKAARYNYQITSVSQAPSTLNNVKQETKSTTADCFGSQFKLSNIHHKCEFCDKSQLSGNKCVSCNVSNASTMSVQHNTVKPASSDLMNKFKFSEGSWECPGCMLRNEGNILTCPCCSASKPSSLKISPNKKKNTSITIVSTPSTETTEAPNVAISDSSNSAVTENLKSNKDLSEFSVNAHQSQSKQLPTNGFGDKFKKPEGAWVCDSCMIQNVSKDTVCIACQAVKPGSSTSNVPNENSASNVQFKVDMPVTAPSFKFGMDKAGEPTKSDNISTTNGFSFGNNQRKNDPSQFTFGIPQTEKIITSTAVASAARNLLNSSEVNSQIQFNFKSTEKTDLEKPPNQVPAFSFGTPKSETNVSSEKKPLTSVASTVSNTPGFTFGMQMATANQPVITNTVQNRSLGNIGTELSNPQIIAVTSTVSNTTPSISLPEASSHTNSSANKPVMQFSFGVPKATIATTKSITTCTATTCLPITTASFSFSDTKNISQPAVPNFGYISTATPTPLSNTFSFSANKMTEVASTKPTTLQSNSTTAPIFSNISNTPSLFGNNEAKTAPAFGAGENKTTAFNSESIKTTFGLPPENKTSSFGSSDNKALIFGATDAKLPVFGNTEKPVPIFNTPQVSATPPATAFGATGTTNPPLFGSSATPVFGNNSSLAFGSGSASSIFPSTKPSETASANPSLFTFGATSSPAVQQPGNGFNFSMNTNSTEPAQKQLFTFGSNSNIQQTNTLFGGASFTASAPTNNTGFTFNAPKQEPPGFGQPAATPTIFGTTQTNPSGQASTGSSFSSTSSNTGFNFGASTTAPVSGDLNFGGMGPTSTSSGGFQFNAPNAAPTVSFNPDTQPSYRFTEGCAPIEFNATPQAQPPRKIKKAVRRIR